MENKTPQGEHLEDIAEYQEKQNLPGYYVGGKLHPALKYPTRRLGWLLLVIILPVVVTGILSWSSNNSSGTTVFGIGGIVPVALVALYVVVIAKLLSKRR